MKKTFLLPVLCLVLSLGVIAQQPEINIVPKPASILNYHGKFALNSGTRIEVGDEMGRQTAERLNDYLQKAYGFRLQYVKQPGRRGNVILIETQIGVPSGISGEEYGLSVVSNGISLRGKGAGLFYALQSLL